MSGPTRKGWCPGVFRPMQTGDGLLVRLRPLDGVLSPAQAGAIAKCAAACGNGHLDLTSRANLQIRGVREGMLSVLVERLQNAALIDLYDESDSVLDIVSSPLAGLDANEWIDVRPVVAALAAKAAREPALRALPAKFGFVVDGGGRLGLADVAADVRFVAVAPDAFEVRLADRAAGECAPEDVTDVATALAARFVEVRGDDGRMRPVIERVGLEAFLEKAEHGPLLALHGGRWPDEVGSDEGGPTRRIASAPAGEGVRVLGFHETHLGVAFPFGRLEASDLATLSRLAADRAAGDIRLTPWRALLVTGLAHSLATHLDPERFILDPDDRRLAVAACPGAPACPSGTTATRVDATALAPLVHPRTRGAIALHVSGCSKGCAHAGPTPVTLVGNVGRYDLVRDGTAQSTPIATGLTARAAGTMLAQTTRGGAGI